MLEVTKSSLRVLRTPNISEELATQSVRNLVFLGRCLGANGMKVAAVNRELKEDVDGDDNDDDQDSDIENGEQGYSQKTELQYLFERLSSILRKEPLTTRFPSLIPKTASLQLLASLCSHLDSTSLRPSLPTILLPLQILTDPSVPPPNSADGDFQTAQKGLVTSSHEILDLLQKKLGTTEFVKQTGMVKEGIKGRREGRRRKRRIEVVAQPEKAGREKKRKNERKKERRREVGAGERSRRRGW
jgi:U3 small nucleolar RNA-associated protein 20